MKLRAEHTAEGYNYLWSDDSGEYNLEYVHGRGKWIRYFRAADRRGQGGWPVPKDVDLDSPEDEEDARRVATEYVGNLYQR